MYTVLGWLFLTAGGLCSWADLPWVALLAYAGALGSFIEAIIGKFRSKK